MEPVAPVQFSGVTEALSTMAMHAYELRQRVIANNIANVDSQDYQPLQVDFEAQLGPLQAAIRDGAAPARIDALLGQIQPRVEAARTTSVAGLDSGENLDDQLLALTQNTLSYEAILTSISRLDGLMRLAVTGS